MARTALDLTQGITEYSSRIALKMLFTQFGEVTACWIPPLEHRGQERAYVKFGTTAAAKAAFECSQAGQLYLDGVALKAEWRLAPSRTQDSRDFEARGSNLQTSRDLMRAQRKQTNERNDRDSIKRQMLKDLEERQERKDRDRDRKKGKERDKSRGRDRSRDRDRRRSRDRSRDRKKKRSRSKSRSKSKSKKRSRSRSKSKRSSKSKSKSRSRSRSKSKSKRRREGSRSRGEDVVVAIEDDPCFTEDGGTSAVL